MLISQQTLPQVMERKFPDPWSPRVTKYLTKEADVRKIINDADFTPEPGEAIQVGKFVLQRIGSLGSIEDGQLQRVVQVRQPEDLPDFLGELCDDPDGPLGDRASAELRTRFDELRCEFSEFGLFGSHPVLSGVRKRREQRKIVNDFARKLFPKDRTGAKLCADMLIEHIDNIEPAVELE
jgi:hypothetical protein